MGIAILVNVVIVFAEQELEGRKNGVQVGAAQDEDYGDAQDRAGWLPSWRNAALHRFAALPLCSGNGLGHTLPRAPPAVASEDRSLVARHTCATRVRTAGGGRSARGRRAACGSTDWRFQL